MIDPVLLAEVTLPEGHPRAGDRCLVFGFVIWHRDGPVLVDTGVGQGHDRVDELFTPRHHPIDDALAERAIRRDDVVMIINSHLHFDHCGNNRSFAGIPMVVQRTEYELAHKPRYTIPEWIDFPGAQWELVEGETEVLAGVRVLPTPGHTPGHQSVAIAATDAVEVIAGQALYDPGELEAEESIEVLTPDKAEATSDSARAIKSLGPTTVYFSHHPGTWPLANT